MDPKKYSRIVNNPRHISGIHNYCDRWCERCPLTLRCSVFALGDAMDGKSPNEREKEKLWPRLRTLETATQEFLEKHADHPGIAPAKEPKFKSMKDRTQGKPLAAAAMRYMEFAHRFVIEHEKSLPTHKPADGGPEVAPAECFEIVAWYHTFMPIKLFRAMHRDEFDEEMENDPDFKDMPRDSDGSAKVALLAMDRSILAWTGLLLHVPELRDTALSAMLTLHRLRRGVEKEIPKARAFERPGFDTLKYPNQECHQ